MSDLMMQQLALIEEIRYPTEPDLCQIKNSHVYADLIFNKINQILTNCFTQSAPLLEADWDSLVMQFIAEYECYSPYYYDIPKQFCDFVMTGYLDPQVEREWLMDMIYFEWLQYDLLIRPSEEQSESLDLQAIQQLQPNINLCSEFWQTHYSCHLLDDQHHTPNYSEQPYYLLFSLNSMKQNQVFEANQLSIDLYDFIAENFIFDSAQLAEEFCIDSGMDDASCNLQVLQEIYSMYKTGLVSFLKPL